MHLDISKSCSDFLRELYKTNTGNKLKASHARELIAAFFGYKSHAALLCDNVYNIEGLQGCDILLPDIALMNRRREHLKNLPGDLESTSDLVKSIAWHLNEELGFTCKVYGNDSLELFYIEGFIPEHVADFDNSLSGLMAETNASFDDFPYVNEAEYIDEGDTVTLTSEGVYEGSLFDDKPYSGHKINFTAVLTLQRVATRRGFLTGDFEIHGAEGEDYRDMDNTLSGGMPLDDGFLLDGGQAKRPKDQFINETGGFIFGEGPQMLQNRLKAIESIRKKINRGEANAEDISRLARLTGSDDDEDSLFN